ncbi:unnamed protein product [Parnassius mnemosyne]|uniref:Uncharacterized protein n=1 Tax=Parnassius mnemosyne TaxID=213953 RepID=A0AAV1L0K9_9NEOP
MLIIPRYQDIPLASLRNMYYQIDGAPAHYARQVKDYLYREYPGRWVGRDGPCAWPPRSPDITPMDFYLWGYVKTLVYTGRAFETRDMLKEKIIWAFDQIKMNHQVLSRVGE